MTTLEQSVGDEDDPITYDADQEGTDSDIEDEDDSLTLAEMYGYDNDEDNEEAALDDVLKIAERGD